MGYNAHSVGTKSSCGSNSFCPKEFSFGCILIQNQITNTIKSLTDIVGSDSDIIRSLATVANIRNSSLKNIIKGVLFCLPVVCLLLFGVM